MMHRRPSISTCRPLRRRPVLEFLALTLVVVTVAFTAGMMVRRGHLARAEAGQTVSLMRVDRPATAQAADLVQHQVVPAAGPREISMPDLTTAPAPAPAPEAAPRMVEPAPVEVAPVVASATESEPAGPMFNGRPLRKAKTMRMLVTAYSPDERSCGASADGITASGYSVWTNGMKMVAADKKLLPFGTVITVPGYHGGQPVPVLDRGGAIKGKRLDVLYPTHEIALQWGKQWVDVTVWEYADED